MARVERRRNPYVGADSSAHRGSPPRLPGSRAQALSEAAARSADRPFPPRPQVGGTDDTPAPSAANSIYALADFRAYLSWS